MKIISRVNKPKSHDASFRNGAWNISNMKESFEQMPESFFNEVDESQILNKSHDASRNNYSVDLNGSFEPLVQGCPAMPKKLVIIPTLNFKKLDDYTKAVKEAKKKKIEERKKQHMDDANNFDEIESILKSS